MHKNSLALIAGLCVLLPAIGTAADDSQDRPPRLTVENFTGYVGKVEVDGGHGCPLAAGSVAPDGVILRGECDYVSDIKECDVDVPETCVAMDLTSLRHTVVVTIGGKRLALDAKLIYTKPQVDGHWHMLGYTSLECDVKETKAGTLTLTCAKGEYEG